MLALACETFDPWCESALELFADIGKRLRMKSGDSRSSFFLMQGLSIELQQGNAACVWSSLQRDAMRFFVVVFLFLFMFPTRHQNDAVMLRNKVILLGVNSRT